MCGYIDTCQPKPPPPSAAEDLVRRIADGWAKLEDECEYRHIPPARFAAMVRAEVHAWLNGKPGA